MDCITLIHLRIVNQMGTFLQFKDFQDFWGECSSKAACHIGLAIFAHVLLNTVFCILRCWQGLAKLQQWEGERRGKANIRTWTGVFENQSFAQKMTRAERNREMQADKDELSQPKS